MAQNSPRYFHHHRHLFIFIFLFLLRRTGATHDDLCRVFEFELNLKEFPWPWNEVEQRLFYQTDQFCQKKPILRSLYYPDLYQFQSPNNRWWTLYQSNTTEGVIGSKQWCQAWNMKPILTLPSGVFQQAWKKAKHLQKWRRVIVHAKNRSYSYQTISNAYLKCSSSGSKSPCETRKVAFLFDLTSSSTADDFQQMKLWSKTLIWLLYNQTSIALSSYRDRFQLIHSFDNQSSGEDLEHLFDSIDTINRYPSSDRRISVPWIDAIHQVVTKIFKRRFLLPFAPKNFTEIDAHLGNESSEEDIYTEPYPLVVNDDEAIKTVLNISNLPPERKRRQATTEYNPAEHVLVILTARSRTLFDYTRREEKLARWIKTVPLRVIVMDFHQISNRRTAEYVHSAFFDQAKLALASAPVRYNFIHTWVETGDPLHGYQLWDHHRRLCSPPPVSPQWNSTLIERTSNAVLTSCSLITLFQPNSDTPLTLKDRLEYTFYQTTDQCFSAPIYRSLSERNLYLQRISNGKWLVIRVDPLLPSSTVKQRKSSTTTSTLPPEFFDDPDYDDDLPPSESIERTALIDHPTSIPHCSDHPGLETLFETNEIRLISDTSFPMIATWISYVNQSEIVSPICNRYRISCQKMTFDILLLLDCYAEDGRFIQNLLQTFLHLIEPHQHRFSLVVLTSSSTDSLQFHLPLRPINTLDGNSINPYFAYFDNHNESIVPLHHHLERVSDYLRMNQRPQTQSVLLTMSSRLNVDRSSVISLRQRYPSIRYMAIDPQLKTDDDPYDPERQRLLRSLVSEPVEENLFYSYAAHRDLTFNHIFRLLEHLCGSLINSERHDEYH